jgi:hypothetical protein
MQLFENETFQSFDDRNSAATFSDMEFRNCEFDNCGLSITSKPELRTIVRNVSLINCKQWACYISRAHLQDVLVDTLGISGKPMFIFGAAFDRVTLRGKIGSVVIDYDDNPVTLDHPKLQKKQIDRFRAANDAFYRSVEWALDISQAAFSHLELRDFPGHLIRRDSETQFLFKRDRLHDEAWRDLPFEQTVSSMGCFRIKCGTQGSGVLIAPRRSRKFASMLRDLQMLRNAGFAEPE